MKKLFVLLCLCSTAGLQAQTAWFNVVGDAAQASINTIEVDPSPVSIDGARRVLRVRVSRSADRVNWDSVAYRSYVSEVMFDCANRTARYLSADFYRQPLWSGEPYKRVVYSPDQYHAMRFRGVEPNPHERIIRAACETHTITNN